jgi:hypothetical protein
MSRTNKIEGIGILILYDLYIFTLLMQKKRGGEIVEMVLLRTRYFKILLKNFVF